MREALGLLVAALVPAVMAVALHPDLADRRRAGLELAEVGLAEVRDWHAPVVWVDARSADEFALDRIPGALSLDPAHFDRDLGVLIGAWTPEHHVVVYCGSRSCGTSRELAARLRVAGLENVHYLHGGWEAWARARR